MKVIWPGFNEMESVIIPLEWHDFIFPRRRVCIDGEWFEPKQELHVTIIGKWAGRLIARGMELDPDLDKRLRQHFQALDWAYEPAGPIHLISRRPDKPEKEAQTGPVEKTVIVRLDMPGMALFYDALKSLGLIARDTPTPPPHVTLYTRCCPGGIGLPDERLLDDLTEKVLPVREFRFR